MPHSHVPGKVIISRQSVSCKALNWSFCCLPYCHGLPIQVSPLKTCCSFLIQSYPQCLTARIAWRLGQLVVLTVITTQRKWQWLKLQSWVGCSLRITLLKGSTHLRSIPLSNSETCVFHWTWLGFAASLETCKLAPSADSRVVSSLSRWIFIVCLIVCISGIASYFAGIASYFACCMQIFESCMECSMKKTDVGTQLTPCCSSCSSLSSGYTAHVRTNWFDFCCIRLA